MPSLIPTPILCRSFHTADCYSVSISYFYNDRKNGHGIQYGIGAEICTVSITNRESESGSVHTVWILPFDTIVTIGIEFESELLCKKPLWRKAGNCGSFMRFILGTELDVTRTSDTSGRLLWPIVIFYPTVPLLFLPPANKIWRQGNVFTDICLSTGGGGLGIKS